MLLKKKPWLPPLLCFTTPAGLLRGSVSTELMSWAPEPDRCPPRTDELGSPEPDRCPPRTALQEAARPAVRAGSTAAPLGACRPVAATDGTPTHAPSQRTRWTGASEWTHRPSVRPVLAAVSSPAPAPRGTGAVQLRRQLARSASASEGCESSRRNQPGHRCLESRILRCTSPRGQVCYALLKELLHSLAELAVSEWLSAHDSGSTSHKRPLTWRGKSQVSKARSSNRFFRRWCSGCKCSIKAV